MPVTVINDKSDGLIDVWMFPVKSCRVYDGDTLMNIVCDLGFGVTINITGRLYGIDAPEVRGEERPDGMKTRDWLREQLDIAETVFVQGAHQLRSLSGSQSVAAGADIFFCPFCNTFQDRLFQPVEAFPEKGPFTIGVVLEPGITAVIRTVAAGKGNFTISMNP